MRAGERKRKTLIWEKDKEFIWDNRSRNGKGLGTGNVKEVKSTHPITNGL